MADIGYINSLLNGLKDPNDRVVLKTIFEHVLNNLREGAPKHQTRSENLQRYWLNSTTASDTSEFSILHGLPATPKYGIPVIEFNRVGAKTALLEVSRVADSRRVYLKAAAGSTNAAVLLLAE